MLIVALTAAHIPRTCDRGTEMFVSLGQRRVAPAPFWAILALYVEDECFDFKKWLTQSLEPSQMFSNATFFRLTWRSPVFPISVPLSIAMRFEQCPALGLNSALPLRGYMPGFSPYQEPGESTLCSLAFFAKVTFPSPSAVWLDRVMLCPYLLAWYAP